LFERAARDNAIVIHRVTKTFGTKVAVNSLDLVIPQGSLYGFIGPNGAGKTTTIRMIMSILFPDSGELSVLGKASAIESKDRIGYLPEERGVYRKMRVGPFLKYIARLKGMDGGSALEKKVRAWLEKVGLPDVYRKRCEELSKGMQQKVQYIAAVIHDPDLIILDEPFSGLDPVNRRLLRGLIDEQHKAGRTLIFSTHAMFEAEQLCTHLFMIHRGNKVLDMPLQQVWNTYDPKVLHVEPIGKVVNADGSGILDFARTLPGVIDVVYSGSGADIRTHEDADLSAIMSAIVTRVAPPHGPGIRRIELRRPNLEDIFIKLVGGDAAALRAENEDADDDTAAVRASSSPEGVES
jgi:ABC-2 type transport system ATP-binding protein